MASLGHNPLGTVPVSALAAPAVTVTDDTPPMGGRMFASMQDEILQEPDIREADAAAFVGSPIEDTPVFADDEIKIIPFSFEELEDEPFDIATFMQVRGPPDQDDDHAPPPVLSRDDDADDDTGGGAFVAQPPDQDDEYVQPRAVASDDDADDADERATLLAPLDDAPAATDDDITGRAFTPDDDEEPQEYGSSLAPLEDTDEEIKLGIFAQVEDDADDERTVTGEPPDQDDEYVPARFTADDAEDEADERAALGAPLNDALACVFPDHVDSTSGSESAPATSHTVGLPGSITAGQRLVAIIAGQGATQSFSWPGGWTEIKDSVSNLSCIAVAYRDCDGTEGASITVTSNLSRSCAWDVIRTTNHDPAYAPEVSTGAGFSLSTSADPDSLSPSWGSDKSLWVAVSANNGAAGARTVSAYPSNYSIGQTNVLGTDVGTEDNEIGLGVALRQLEAASEDPGAFTLSGTGSGLVLTIAIKGICNVADDGRYSAAVTLGDDADVEPQEYGFAASPLEDAPLDSERTGQITTGDDSDDEPQEYGFASQPLEDTPAAPEETITKATLAPDEQWPDEDERAFTGSPLEDGPAVVTPPAPTIPTAGGAGWWIANSRRPKPKWPDLPQMETAPPWKLKVVQPKDARLRIAAQEREWKRKMRRSRQAEDELILGIIASILREQDDE